MTELTHTQSVDIERQGALYVQGCKITAGARVGPPPPSYRLAKILVLAKRASERIMEPASATLIQKQYRAYKTHKVQREECRAAASNFIATVWRAHQQRLLAAMELQRKLYAALRIQTAARRLHAKAFRLNVLATRIQKHARGILTRRRYREALVALRSIQATWQMVRSQVVGRRLAGATARLQAGALLSKYQKGGFSHERHERFVWLSKDRKKLCWADAALATAASEERAKFVNIEAVTAVTSDVKTSLMKKMKRRAENSSIKELLRKPAAALISGRALPLDAACAFSLISRDRMLDLYAPDETTCASWLRDLRTILVYAHHFDHKAAVGAIEAGIRRGSLVEPPEEPQAAAAA
eukprot:CAMPEP_0115852370 /NCGR_PEP_ID=MMETSP0287-20121206/12961_1 /TAXON_ID=412157 /ORGANISM="Chrysochromulina rotalis, Strain UIO044" /LENGTH=354 /DNA_ID=CAMNT_0003306429 /DNA_START=39 /DNA_END=1103 /DNA_ORIENTATION=+